MRAVPPPLGAEAGARLLQAFGRLAEFSQRVERECSRDLLCGEGCHGCCGQILVLRGVEAAHLLAGVRALPPEAVSRIWEALSSPGTGCPLLHRGLCLAYDHRPAVCRTHGLVMIRRDVGGTLLHHCPRNFQDTDVSRLPPAFVLDEARLALLMDTVDALYARESGWEGGRVAVDDLLRAGLQA